MIQKELITKKIIIMTPQTIKFTKMHGAGNDYIYVNTLLYDIPSPAEAAIKWSSRHKGIGSDGLVMIGRAASADADFSMRIFNADGSEAMMCGNASRCIGKYLYEKGMTSKKSIRLETLSGIKTLLLDTDGHHVRSVTVDMLEPKFNAAGQFMPRSKDEERGIIEIDGKRFEGTFVSMGNPHFVIFTDEEGLACAETYGPKLEHHAAFPARCNIEFAHVSGKNTIRTRVWERGSGITMACGTGACATAVAAAKAGKAERCSRIIMDGGTLEIEWNETDNHVYLKGEAEFVFEGEIDLP